MTFIWYVGYPKISKAARKLSVPVLPNPAPTISKANVLPIRKDDTNKDRSISRVCFAMVLFSLGFPKKKLGVIVSPPFPSKITDLIA